MTDPVTAFLPCRKGSERVVQKNTRPFAGQPGGLIQMKMAQLLEVKGLAEIVVSTDDPVVRERCTAMAREGSTPVRIVDRPDHLASSAASTDDLIRHVPTLIARGAVLWTHVTSPFVDAGVYDEALRTFRDRREAGTHDSLATVTRVQTYLWNDEGPINYDRDREKWPRTQTLPVWYELNSAVFLADLSVYRDQEDRLGRRPFLFELDGLQSLDIDREDDFALAEAQWRARRGRDGLSGTGG